MDNHTDKNNLFDSIIKESGGKIDRKAAESAAKSGKADALIKNLSKEDRQKLNDILNDKQALESVLKSPKAAAILKLLSGGGKNG